LAVTTVRVKVGDRWYTVEVGDLTRSPVEVTVEGQIFHVEIEGLSPRAPARARRPQGGDGAVTAPSPAHRPTAAPPSDKILRAPMPGRVIAIMVRPGDRVTAGQEVCVVEAMKMEQSIWAPRDGVVKAVHVQPMDSVGANDPLLELE